MFEYLEKMYAPESEVASQQLYDQYIAVRIPPHGSPITALHAMEDLSDQIEERGLATAMAAAVAAEAVVTAVTLVGETTVTAAAPVMARVATAQYWRRQRRRCRRYSMPLPVPSLQP